MRISDWSSDVCSSDLTRSRKTRANPTSRTPLGAVIPGATGIRQGTSGTQTVPSLPIIQLAAGTHAVNATRKERSEERQVGKEGDRTCRSRWSACNYKKTRKHKAMYATLREREIR